MPNARHHPTFDGYSTQLPYLTQVRGVRGQPTLMLYMDGPNCAGNETSEILIHVGCNIPPQHNKTFSINVLAINLPYI
jgi:hypothetical protein